MYFTFYLFTSCSYTCLEWSRSRDQQQQQHISLTKRNRKRLRPPLREIKIINSFGGPSSKPFAASPARKFAAGFIVGDQGGEGLKENCRGSTVKVPEIRPPDIPGRRPSTHTHSIMPHLEIPYNATLWETFTKLEGLVQRRTIFKNGMISMKCVIRNALTLRSPQTDLTLPRCRAPVAGCSTTDHKTNVFYTFRAAFYIDRSRLRKKLVSV